MYAQYMLAIGIFLMTLLAIPLIGQDAEMKAEKDTIEAMNFIVYQDAVREYAINHSGHSGTVSDSDLDLPPQYVNQGWNNRFVSGTAWAYGDIPGGGVLEMAKKMDYPVNFGIKKSGTLHAPGHGDTGISVPAFINNGQIVMVMENI